jgi:hypothetical protein
MENKKVYSAILERGKASLREYSNFMKKLLFYSVLALVTLIGLQVVKEYGIKMQTESYPNIMYSNALTVELDKELESLGCNRSDLYAYLLSISSNTSSQLNLVNILPFNSDFVLDSTYNGLELRYGHKFPSILITEKDKRILSSITQLWMKLDTMT